MSSESREGLADYVRRVRREKGLSTLDVERNSGNRITDGYVSQIENGYVKNVSPEKLTALAKGLDVLEDDIFAVARGVQKLYGLPLNEVRMLELYRALPDERKEDVLAHLEFACRRYADRPSPVTKDGPQQDHVYEAIAGTPETKTVLKIPRGARGQVQQKEAPASGAAGKGKR